MEHNTSSTKIWAPYLAPLPKDLARWDWLSTRRVYYVINGGSTSLGALAGTFDVDGHTFRVAPPSGLGNCSKHRVFIVLTKPDGSTREIPLGRIGQAHGRGLRRYPRKAASHV